MCYRFWFKTGVAFGSPDSWWVDYHKLRYSRLSIYEQVLSWSHATIVSAQRVTSKGVEFLVDFGIHATLRNAVGTYLPTYSVRFYLYFGLKCNTT